MMNSYLLLLASSLAVCVSASESEGCLPPVAPADGDYSPKRKKFQVGVKVTYSCSNGYKLSGKETSECIFTGDWSSPAPSCDSSSSALGSLGILPVVVLIGCLIYYLHSRKKTQEIGHVEFCDTNDSNENDSRNFNNPRNKRRKRRYFGRNRRQNNVNNQFQATQSTQVVVNVHMPPQHQNSAEFVTSDAVSPPIMLAMPSAWDGTANVHDDRFGDAFNGQYTQHSALTRY